MSDGESLPPSVPFTRGCKARASLPVGRSSGQARERPGVLYLQYGEETKQVRMPTEISSQDALRALFVTAFPHQLTMKMLQSPNMAIFIKDTSRNVYYDLEDIRNIADHSCLKAYHKDPAHVFQRHARPANTEGRISKEVLYGNHSPVHTLPSSSRSTLHSLQGSMSPPMVRSMPSSPSRLAYSRASGGVVDPGSAILPREHLSGSGRSSSLCTTSSAILERRDVKPDDDAGSNKSMALVVRGDGGPHYQDSYSSSLQEGGGGRLSISSSQCSAPPSLTADIVDAGVLGIPGGLQQYRASIKPLMGYGESMEHQTRSLHRQKSRKYDDSQLPPLGTKTPPPSPHRANDVRMIDGQIIGGVGLVSLERISPIRRSLRRDSNGTTVEIVNRSRGSGSSSSTSSVFMDSPLGQPERVFQGHATSSNAQSERMKAMEEQIASLAGLVHHALSMGSDVPGVKNTISENTGRKLPSNRTGVSSEASNPAAVIGSFSPAPLTPQASPSGSRLQQQLESAKTNLCDLRMQLDQLRHLQLSNQESVNSMLRMAGQELMVLMCDRMAQSEEGVYRRRAEMEEERICFLASEDSILTQLSELEEYVDRLQRSSASSPSQLSITLRDVEEGAVSLRRVGETLAILRGEFPELQMKMRSVLRLEVEAVRFLKEEPHKMDSMLKRVKSLTETLSSLRRCVSESNPLSRSTQGDPLKALKPDPRSPKTQSPQSSPKPQPRSSVRPPLPTPSVSGSQAEVSLNGSASPITPRRMKTTATSVVQPSYHYPSPPLTPSHGQDSPTVAKVSPRSSEGSPAHQRRSGPHMSEGLDQCTPTPAQKRHSDQTVQTAERHSPESVQGIETSTSRANQPASPDSTHPSTSTDVLQVLQEAQASLMNSIPDLDVSDPSESHFDSASGQTAPTASKSEQDKPLDLTLQASVEQQAFLSDKKEDTPPKLSDEVDSTQLKPPDIVSAAASQHPAATVALPLSVSLTTPPSPVPSASSSTDRPQVEKPRRSSVDKEMKQSPDRVSQSPPPPPPPRRFLAVNSGLTTGRSGEVVFTTRKESVGAQDEGGKEKEAPVAPQPKPPRQPPEIKPKPQICVPKLLAGSSAAPTTASSHREDEEGEEEEEEEEEEEDNKFMKELQVFEKYTMRDGESKGMVELQGTTEMSNKDNLPGGNKQKAKGNARASSTSQEANQNPELATCEQQSSPHLGMINHCRLKTITVHGLEEHSEGGKNSASHDKKKDVEEKVKQIPFSNCVPEEKTLEEGPTPVPKKGEKTGLLDSSATQKGNEKKKSVNTSNQINKKVAGTAENKVKFTATVTLQKENTQGTITSTKQTNEKVVKEPPSEKKSNLTVVVTLQKENPPEDGSIEQPPFQQSLSSDQEHITSAPILKPLTPFPLSPSLTQKLEETTHGSRDQSRYTEEGSSLNPSSLEDEGPPPPPPPSGKFSHSILKSRMRTQTKEEDPAKTNGSDMQYVVCDSTGTYTYVGYDNHGFADNNESGTEPIFVILNDPLEIQSAYKRLSTIFECEEDLFPVEMIENGEETKQGEQHPGRKICANDINAGLSFKDATGNHQNSPRMQHVRSSSNDDPLPENQDQGKPDTPRKTETKRKFKFKFPKNKLAAISQAIRTGANKTAKKTVEVVVYEEEEEMTSDSSPVKETQKQTKESKRFEINSASHSNLGKGSGSDVKVSSSIETRQTKSQELCKNTLDSINSLEDSIKQLEISVDSIASPPSSSSIVSSPPQTPKFSTDSTDRAHLKGKVKQGRERSPSKRPATQILKGPNPPQVKRAKPQPPHDSGKSITKKQTSRSSSSSPVQHSKSRHSSSSSSQEKKQQQQANQKQPSQADNRSSRAAGDSNHCVVALRGSKIPALCHSTGKHLSASLSTPHCTETTERLRNLSYSSSSSASSPSASSTSSCGKHFLLSPSRQQDFLCPLSSSSVARKPSSVSLSETPPQSYPSSSSSRRSHKSFIPSLNLRRLLPSSSHVLSPSHANVSQARRGSRSSSTSRLQHCLVLASTTSTTSSTASQHSCYSSSSYSSPSPSSSSTSSSLSPTSTPSSPPSPSSSLLPSTVSHGARNVRTSASKPSSPGHSKKRTGSQAARLLRTALTPSKDVA